MKDSSPALLCSKESRPLRTMTWQFHEANSAPRFVFRSASKHAADCHLSNNDELEAKPSNMPDGLPASIKSLIMAGTACNKAGSGLAAG